MFLFAILIGVLSNVVLFLGLLGLLYPSVLITVLGVICLGFIFYNKLTFSSIMSVINQNKKERLFFGLFFLFFLQVMINLVGAMGPEIGFDALWYHLTLPKLYLLEHKVFFIPGGLLYYSAMPKLGEMLYAIGLSFGSETYVKLMHFSFGLLSCIVLYKLSRKFVSPTLSFLSVLIFYSNLVVSWESISAYIDLIRCFYEVIALYAFSFWVENKSTKYLFLSAIFIGFAIETKLLAVGSLVIFTILFFIHSFRTKQDRQRSMTGIPVYWSLVLLISVPWFVFSYLHTGNSVYPFFTTLYPSMIDKNIFSLYAVVNDLWKLFVIGDDPISPIYLIVLPFLIVCLKKFNQREKLLIVYAVLALIIWYITPRTGGGRFILPYLPAFSLLVVIVMRYFQKQRYIYNIMIITVIFLAVTTIGYRAIANAKFVPEVFGKESKSDFLVKHLHFDFGDFYDIDGYFAKTISPKDKVLLYGFHNLYYVNFTFVDKSWVKKGDRFNYIAIQNTSLPTRFKNWKIIYQNNITHVTLYTDNKKTWIY